MTNLLTETRVNRNLRRNFLSYNLILPIFNIPIAIKSSLLWKSGNHKFFIRKQEFLNIKLTWIQVSNHMIDNLPKFHIFCENLLFELFGMCNSFSYSHHLLLTFKKCHTCMFIAISFHFWSVQSPQFSSNATNKNKGIHLNHSKIHWSSRKRCFILLLFQIGHSFLAS